MTFQSLLGILDDISILSSDGGLENGHTWQQTSRTGATPAGNAAQDILNLLDLDNSPSTPKARPITALDDFAFLAADDSTLGGVNGKAQSGVTMTVLEKNGLKMEFTVSRSSQPDTLEIAVAVNNFSMEEFSKFDMKVAPIKVSP